jgi:hypothetical protein
MSNPVVSAAEVIEALTGPVGFCGPHCDRAEALGRTVRRERLSQAPRQQDGGMTNPEQASEGVRG